MGHATPAAVSSELIASQVTLSRFNQYIADTGVSLNRWEPFLILPIAAIDVEAVDTGKLKVEI